MFSVDLLIFDLYLKLRLHILLIGEVLCLKDIKFYAIVWLFEMG